MDGKKYSQADLDSINLECDLINLISNYAWPHADKIAKRLMQSYDIKPKSSRPVALSVSAKNEA